VNFLLSFVHNLYAALAIPLRLSISNASLLRMLVRRDLVNRSSGTLLGRAWPLLQTGLQVAGFWFLFDIIYGMRAVRGPSFLEYLLSGMLPWFCLTEVLTRGSGMFREFSNLYRRSPFPVEILPVLLLLVPGLVYSVVYVLICFFMYGALSALASMLVIPLLLLWLLPLLYLFSVLGVFLRDFAQALPILLMFMMYATPILYFPDMVPAGMRSLLWLNPFTDLMRCIHELVELQPLPLEALLRLWGLWLLLLGPSWVLFRRSLPHVREVL
jgi:lipopolysaccharide transport system permease protein